MCIRDRVGGAWVWYQRMQSSAQLGGEAGVEKIKAGTGVQYLYIDRAYSSGNKVELIIGNQGPENVRLTGLKVDNTTKYYDCNSTFANNNAPYTVTSGGFFTAKCVDVVAPSSGTAINVKIYSGAITKEMQTVIE